MAECGSKNKGIDSSLTGLAKLQSDVASKIAEFTPDPSFIKNSIPFIFGNGQLVNDSLTAIIGGATYTDFLSCSITRSVASMAGTFSLTLRDRWRYSDEGWPFIPGTKVQLQVGAYPSKHAIITGYIDKVEVSVTAEEREVIISGRDKTGDLIDCSVDFKQSELKNLSLVDIAKMLCEPFGIGVTFAGTASAGGLLAAAASSSLAFFSPDAGSKSKKPKFNIKPGETVFNILHDLCKESGYLMYPDEFGDLIIFDRKSAGLSKSPVPLVQGENILSANGTYDFTDRYSQYVVKGQAVTTNDFFGSKTTEPEGRASDCAVERYRSLVIISERDTDAAKATERAQWEATTRATKSTDVSIVVQGWSRPDSSIWSVNELVPVDAGFIGINEDLVVNSVQFTKNTSGGTLTTLGLSRKDSYIKSADLEAEADPIKKPIGWQSPGAAGTIENVYKLFTSKVPSGF